MKIMIKLAVLAGIAATTLMPASMNASPNGGVKEAKYVFFFIGDGMSAVQIYAADGYLTALNGGEVNMASGMSKSAALLNLDKLPVRGMQRTYANNHLITDSAAAGTALACGSKTNSGVLGMDPTKNIDFKSIAKMAKESGRKVAILSSVSLDHATPASFYANTESRRNYDEIAVDAALSNFDFFGGGSWLELTNSSYETLYPKLKTTDLGQIFVNEGYTTINTNEGIRALKSAPKGKVICTVPILQSSAAMPYNIDRPAGQVSLAELTEVAIDCMMRDNKKGFFMMVEGGKVDWACHANDPVGMLSDVLDLDNAIGKAMEFYKQHPNETLIVVTGDHETGGLTIGFSGRGYETSFEKLLGQKISYEAFTKLVKEYKENKGFAAPYDMALNNIDPTMKGMIKANFDIDYDALSEYRKSLLEAAYDRSMSGAALAGKGAPSGYERGFGDAEQISSVDYLYYGDYDALTMEISHQMSFQTGLGWTTYSHTAVPVPVMAMGCGDELFSGYYENTDVAKKLAAVMHIDATLPVLIK